MSGEPCLDVFAEDIADVAADVDALDHSTMRVADTDAEAAASFGCLRVAGALAPSPRFGDVIDDNGCL